MDIQDYINDPKKLLQKEPFTRGVSEEYLQIYRAGGDYADPIAEIPRSIGKIISQNKYLMELDPTSHDINFNSDLPRLSSNPNATWSQAHAYRAAFGLQSQILSQHSQHVNTNGMKFVLLNQEPNESIEKTFVQIKNEWVTRNMDIYKTKLYEAQKSMGDAALLFYFNRKQKCRTRLLSYEKGYNIIPIYDENEELLLCSVYYKSAKTDKRKIDTYDDTYIYRFEELENGEFTQVGGRTEHGFSEIPIVYKRGDVAWEKGQQLIDIFEFLYNIYLIILKKVGFPILYVIGETKLERKSDTAVILNDSSSDSGNSNAKFLNPDEPKGFQKVLEDIFKKIQITTSSVLLAPDDIKITADISGLAIKMLRSSVYERAQRDIQDYDAVADKMFDLFKEGVSKELGEFSQWNRCKIRASFQLWSPQSDTEYVNRLVIQKQSGIISGETATDLSPDAQPDEIARMKREILKETKEDENNKDDI